MIQEQIQLPHKLILNERKSLSLSGVTEVVSFDDSAVISRTNMGLLHIQGQDLQLKTISLEGGQVAVDGNISAIIYEELRQPRGFLSRFLG